MQLHSLVNSTALARQAPLNFPTSDELENPAASRSKAPKGNQARATTAMFITPQSLVAFPFASGLVAGMWQATQALGIKDHNYIGFIISMFVGAVVYD